MTELTTGQRIGECRKKLGLSQEALGERVGVSRQAISKWEADAAMPDVDKLIALSRLFSVSVGWLLGVEEQPQSQPETPQITEELLRKIEEVVRSYQSQKKPLSPFKKLLIAFAVILLILCASALRGELAETQAQVSHLTSQIQNSHQDYARILQTMVGLEDQIDQLSKSPSHFSIADWSYEIQPDSEKAQAMVALTAIPGLWQEDYAAVLSVRREGAQVASQNCAWDGNALTARLVLPLENGYEYWLTAKYADGTQEQVELPNSTARNLKASFTISCHISRGDAYFSRQKGTMSLNGYAIQLDRPNLTSGYDVEWARVDLILYHNRQILHTEALFDPENFKEDQRPGQLSEIYNFTFFPDGPYPLPALEEGDGLELWISAEMTNGISLMQMVDSWAYLNGEFITGTPEAPLA